MTRSMGVRALLVSAAMFASSVAASAWAGPAAALVGWTAESPGGALTGASLAAVEYGGELHVFGASGSGLAHMVRGGDGTWASQDLDAAMSPASGVVAVVVGADLHVLGRPASGTGLRHTWWSAGSWHFETVDVGASAGTGLGAVGYFGQLQVFGARAGGPGLRQAVFDPGRSRWYFADLDTGGSSGSGVSAGVYWGELHLFGASSAGAGIRHVVYSTALGRWVAQDLEVGTSDGSHASAAFGLGELHVFAPDASGVGLRHAVYVAAAGTWAGQSLGSATAAGVNPVAAFLYGEMHVFDAAPSAAGIGHMVYSPAARDWGREVLDAGASTGSALSVVAMSDRLSMVDAAAGGGMRHVYYTSRPARVTLTGKGWGHGVGMSQHGAAGWARRGASAQDIVLHYFRNTVIGPAPALDQVRVGVTQDQSAVTGAVAQPAAAVCSGSGATIWFQGGFTYRAAGSGGQFSASAGALACTSPVWVNYGAPGGDIYLDNAGHHYRHGTLELSVAPNGLSRGVMVVFAEGGYAALDVYLYGLAEVPSSWPAEALKAQVLAAKSYAAEKISRLGQHRSGCDCALTSTTSDQAYVGFDKESEAGGWGAYWVAAVRAVAGQAINYGGAPIPAYYADSSGGWTENVENVWGGAPAPYLVGVPDPYDGEGNKYATWTASLTWDQLQAALGANPATAVGALYDVSMTGGFGVSGRPLFITIVGSAGTKVVRSTTFASTLKLKSTLFSWTAG